MGRTSQTDVERGAALARCLELFRAAPAGLLTDIDGTISEIAPRPEEAIVAEPARDALSRLSRRLAVVGVVTGRGAAAGAALVKAPGLIYVGNHGLEWIKGDATWHHPAAEASADEVRSALVEIAERLRGAGLDAGTLFEDKHLSGSIHYRLAPEPEATRGALLAAAAQAAERRGLLVTEGRLVVEIRPMVRINKGSAIDALVAEHGLQAVVFLGDDVTDVDAFLAVRALRDRGVCLGLNVGVLSAETPESVLAAVDVTVASVAACVELLVSLADRCDGAVQPS